MADSKPAVMDAAGAFLVASLPARVRPNPKLIGLRARGHLVIDVIQGSLSAILPFLKNRHRLTYAQAAMPIAGFAVARRRPAPRVAESR